MNAKKHQTYRILGIDPGTNVLGYAVLEICDKEPTIICLDAIHMKHLDEAHHFKLKRIFEGLQVVIKDYSPTIMAIEAPFYGKNVQAMLKLGRAQGVAIAAGITAGLDIVEYLPKRIKQSVTGNGNAAKEQVAAMLASIFKTQFNKDVTLDATDALAVALCHHFQTKYTEIPQGGAKKHYKDWASFAKENVPSIAKK